mgnify:CR=1 FL=1
MKTFQTQEEEEIDELNRELEDAELAGAEARRQGIPLNANPYKNNWGTTQAVWERAWLEEDATLRFGDTP